MPTSAIINVMVQAARYAGRKLARDFGEVEQLQVSIKGPSDFVSAADRRAEQIIFEELSKARPNYGFLMEERGRVEGNDPTHCWIVDPLDGTTNFLHSIPLFAISIALQRNGEIVAGIVYNPISDELYTAERGKGAYLDEQRIRVAARTNLNDCVISTGIPHLGRENHEQFQQECGILMRRVAGIRRTGSAAIDLAWVAAGRFDGYWERGLSPWDVAAGMIIVREAGGFVSDLDSRKDPLVTGSIVAGNERIHNEIRNIANDVTKKE